MRDNIAREQLVGSDCRCAVGPILRRDQVATDFADGFPQLLQIGLRPVRRADDHRATGVQPIDRRVEIVIGLDVAGAGGIHECDRLA